MLKNKKKLFIILTAIVALIIVSVLMLVLFKETGKEKDSGKTETPNNEVVIPDAPSKDTESLIQNLEKVEVKSLNNDVIEFSEDIEVETGEKVAVWVYSSPKFLGYFEVVVEDGVKMIKGLAEAMKELDMESGDHNIAIVTEEGKSIGYFDVYVDENKLFEDEKAAVESKYTTKEVKEEVEVKFKTETKKEANMKSGTKEVTQKGVNGVNEITYKVTYDENGKEISKEKISEKTIKKAINEIVVVGTADFNLNTSKITSGFGGFMCTEDKKFIYDGSDACNDMEDALPSFYAIVIDNAHYYVVKVDDSNITPVKITKSGSLYKGTYNGTTYYFDSRSGGGEDTPLTEDVCKQYNLSCGSW